MYEIRILNLKDLNISDANLLSSQFIDMALDLFSKEFGVSVYNYRISRKVTGPIDYEDSLWAITKELPKNNLEFLDWRQLP